MEKLVDNLRFRVWPIVHTLKHCPVVAWSQGWQRIVEHVCLDFVQNSAQYYSQHLKEKIDWPWIFASGCGRSPIPCLRYHPVAGWASHTYRRTQDAGRIHALQMSPFVVANRPPQNFCWLIFIPDNLRFRVWPFGHPLPTEEVKVSWRWLKWLSNCGVCTNGQRRRCNWCSWCRFSELYLNFSVISFSVLFSFPISVFSSEVETTTPTTPKRENPCAAGLFSFGFLHQSYTCNYTNYTLFWKSLRGISMHCAYSPLETAEKV